jgi:hypothetical protein
MYFIALKNAQLGMQAKSYIEFRKLLDAGFNAKFKYVMYAVLITNLLLVLITVKQPAGLLFITAATAFIAIVIDTMIAVKGNIPINNLINTWSADQYPGNWFTYRTKWLQYFRYRQLANITGFISLAIGAIFGMQ